MYIETETENTTMTTETLNHAEMITAAIESARRADNDATAILPTTLSKRFKPRRHDAGFLEV